MTIAFQVRLPRALVEKLDERATVEGKSRNALIVSILTKHAEDGGKRLQDYSESELMLEMINRPGLEDLVITYGDMRLERRGKKEGTPE